MLQGRAHRLVGVHSLEVRAISAVAKFPQQEQRVVLEVLHDQNPQTPLPRILTTISTVHSFASAGQKSEQPNLRLDLILEQLPGFGSVIRAAMRVD
jgi:hypothetical protein